MGILMEITLNVEIALGSMDIITVSIPWLQEHRVSSFPIIGLYFLEFKSFTFLVKLIPMYFILFDAIVSGFFS